MTSSDEAALRVDVATRDDVAQARAAWNGLLARARHPVIFLSWEWVATWLESLSAGSKPRILFVRDRRNDIVGILPLARARRRVGGMPASVLTFCGTELYPDHLDLICAREADANKLLDACFAHLVQIGEVSPVLDLPFLAAQGVLARYLREGRAGGYGIGSIVQIPSLYVDLGNGYEAYLSSMSKKKRYNLNRERKTLLEDHGARFSRVDSRESVVAAIRSLFELHAKRAEDKGLASSFVGSDLIQFHQRLALRLAEADQVRLYHLQIANDSIATVYGFLLNREFSFYQMGFDPGWKKYSPGKVTISLVLEQLANEGALLFDFLGGGDEYKHYWATGTRDMSSFIAFRASFSGLASRFGYRLLQAVRAARRRWIARSLERA